MFAIFEDYLDEKKDFYNKVFHYLPIVAWGKVGDVFKPIVLVDVNGGTGFQVGEDNRLIAFDLITNIGFLCAVYTPEQLQDMLSSESVMNFNATSIPFFMIEHKTL